MASYRCIMTWNNNRVFEGTASAVIAWHVVRHLMIDNFAGDTKARGDLQAPTLVDLSNASIGARFAGGVGDETGTATFIVERIA